MPSWFPTSLLLTSDSKDDLERAKANLAGYSPINKEQQLLTFQKIIPVSTKKSDTEDIVARKFMNKWGMDGDATFPRYDQIYVMNAGGGMNVSGSAFGIQAENLVNELHAGSRAPLSPGQVTSLHSFSSDNADGIAAMEADFRALPARAKGWCGPSKEEPGWVAASDDFDTSEIPFQHVERLIFRTMNKIPSHQLLQSMLSVVPRSVRVGTMCVVDVDSSAPDDCIPFRAEMGMGRDGRYVYDSENPHMKINEFIMPESEWWI